MKCLFEFTRLCNGVGVKTGCQTGASDSLKIHKGQQSTDVIHVYCKLILAVSVVINEQWRERVQGYGIFYQGAPHTLRNVCKNIGPNVLC